MSANGISAVSTVASASLRSVGVRILLVLLTSLAGVFAFSGTAFAASGQVKILPVNYPPAQLTGTDVTYVVNFTCSATEVEICGDDPEIRIPINLDPSATPVPPFDDWTFSVTSAATPGLVSSWSRTGNELIVKLDPAKVTPGDSLTINLAVRPPNLTTPNGTSWTILPTYSSSTISETEAPEAAPGAVKAEGEIRVTKAPSPFQQLWVAGSTITWKITADCNSTGTSGVNLGSLAFPDGTMLVDDLPAEVEFVSASPAPTSAPAVGDTGQVIWDLSGPDAARNCAQAGGQRDFEVVTKIRTGLPDGTTVKNVVTHSGTPLGESPMQDKADWAVTVISSIPTPGNSLTKRGHGPLAMGAAQPNSAELKATYAGPWMAPHNSSVTGWVSPSTSNSEVLYDLVVEAPAMRDVYRYDVVDPMPCLDNRSGPYYESLPVTPPVNGVASAPLCANPAVHPYRLWVWAEGLDQAIANGWRPQAIRTDGTAIDLAPVPGYSSIQGNFLVPAAEIGDITALRLPPTSDFPGRVNVRIAGYADETTGDGDILRNVAAASVYVTGETDPRASWTRSADVFVLETLPQLGVKKSMSTVQSDGRSSITLTGSATLPPAGYTMPGPFVIADLLPTGMTLGTPTPADGNQQFSLRKDGVSQAAVIGQAEHIANFEGTGRTLVRYTIPASAFSGGGYYEVWPVGTLPVRVPVEGQTFINKANVFISNNGRNTLNDCSTQFGPSHPQTLETEDPRDLDGDGETDQYNCSTTAQIIAPALPGPAFGLSKQVQGDLDNAVKGAGEIGLTTDGGRGEYTLTWKNIGSEPLTDPVIYDILPHVGDTGVSQGQSNVQRGSETRTLFDSITDLPTGVTVEYSGSSNPCRPEVYPAAPGCVNDWSSTPQTDVRSLRFKTIGSYASGSSFSLKFKVSLPLGQTGMTAWNSAATASDFNGSALLPAEPPKVGLVSEPAGEADLGVVKTKESPANVNTGDTVTYEIVVTNHGPADATGVTLQDILPDGLEGVTVNNSDCAVAGSEIDCALGDLANGASVTITVTGKVKPGQSSLVNTAVVDGDLPDPNPDNNEDAVTTPVTPQSDVQIVKTVDDQNPQAGDTITYRLTVRNNGPDLATGVRATDHLPVGVTFLSADAPCVEAGGTVSGDFGNLAPGQEADCEIRVRVNGWNPAPTSADHGIDVQKVETQVDLNPGETRTLTAECPTGFFVSDGSVRIDHIDQGTGSWVSPQVLESRASDSRTWRGTVRNTASGRAQAKIFAVCIRETTSPDTTGHDLLVTGPVTETVDLQPGNNEVVLNCPVGTVAIAPGFTADSPGYLVYSQPEGDGWKFNYSTDADEPNDQVTYSISCLARELVQARGHSHLLSLQQIWTEQTIQPGQVHEVQLICPDGSRGIVGGWDLDPGLVSLGNDPRPVTRAFRVYNTTDQPLRVRYSLLCLGDRTTSGGQDGSRTIVNTARVVSVTPDPDLSNNQSSVTVTATLGGGSNPVTDPIPVVPGKPPVNNPTDQDSHRPGVTLLSARVKAGSVSITLKATGQTSGVAKLVTTKKVKVGGKRYGKGTVLASARYWFGMAGSKKIKLKYNRFGKRVLKQRKARQAKLVVGGKTLGRLKVR
ncbi:MAG: DUF11 domain-containing protein [Solirubrobacterales bacterium]|nr:DUF11 domain-containing protein [Solirubrobacterales bacterium]